MFQRNVIPATISLHQLNPRIPALDTDGTVIATSNTPWHTGPRPRTALLNNFGASGSNCALLLEEPRTPPRTGSASGAPFLLCMSCKTEDALEQLRQHYLSHLRERVNSADDTADFAYTATVRRQAYGHRIAVSGASSAELYDRLSSATISRASEQHQKVVFLFSGQGSHYAGMGAVLYRTSDVFRETVDLCESKLRSHSLPGARGIILGDSDLQRGDCSQTATFVLECALARLWKSWGVEPSAVGGHRHVWFGGFHASELTFFQSRRVCRLSHRQRDDARRRFAVGLKAGALDESLLCSGLHRAPSFETWRIRYHIAVITG